MYSTHGTVHEWNVRQGWLVILHPRARVTAGPGVVLVQRVTQELPIRKTMLNPTLLLMEPVEHGQHVVARH